MITFSLISAQSYRIVVLAIALLQFSFPFPCQVLEGRHFLQVLGGHEWKALKDEKNSSKRKRKR